jgi:hypothetical protein
VLAGLLYCLWWRYDARIFSSRLGDLTAFTSSEQGFLRSRVYKGRETDCLLQERCFGGLALSDRSLKVFAGPDGLNLVSIVASNLVTLRFGKIGEQ